MSNKLDRRYIPIKDRTNSGELNFPSLKCKTPDIITLEDMRKENVNLTLKKRETLNKRTSKTNKKMNDRLGTSLEFRRLRYNISYKPIIDLIGESFPLHPEYLFVIDTVLKYYGVPASDVMEFGVYMDSVRYDTSRRFSYCNKTFTSITSKCFEMVIYVLYVQYEVNPNVIMHLFSISLEHLRSVVECFCRQYEKSEVLRADWSQIHGRLIQLEG